MKYNILLLLFLSNINVSSFALNTFDKEKKLKIDDSIRIDSLVFKTLKFKLIHTFCEISTYSPDTNFFLIQNCTSREVNRFTRLILINQKDHDTIFNILSDRFTFISIDKKEKYVIALSEFNSEYNIQVNSIDGNLVFGKHISAIEVGLDIQLYDIFKEKYPSSDEKLKKDNRVIKKNNLVYIDVIPFRKLNIDSSALDFLRHKPNLITKNHLNIEIKSSTDGTIDFFDDSKPIKKIRYRHGLMIGLILNSNTRKKANINFSRYLK